MKVLHIWNTAGVGSLMAKELRKKGYHVDVMMRTGYDPFKMSEYYGLNLLNLGGNQFKKHSIESSSEYDIIHIHGIWDIAPIIKMKYPDKKVILQHHGTELTRCSDNHSRIESYKYCDTVICSTSDLSDQLKYETVEHDIIENAVDTDLFKPSTITMNKMKPALLFDIRYTDTPLIEEFVKANTDWDIHTIDRENDFVSYTEMPILLQKYDKYIDVKIYEWLNGKPGQAYSKTGREALACGLKVLNYKGEIVQGLPEEYTPEYMVNKLIKLYNS